MGLGIVIGIVGVFGLIVALAPDRDEPKSGKKRSGAPPVWQPEPVRIAACAMLANEIYAPAQIAQGIANAVWPDHSWPPSAKSTAAEHRVWADAVRYAEKVLADPASHCGVVVAGVQVKRRG